ncbi:LPS export ABC transporter permease LptF [Psychromarinibacter halotolerans]|uniref:LPS export ABC transporter permease LptF n=1 Tax=Psychromarinibacter halotolerans TaxID=1775175 RepID=A0ABV7GY51_9RHOB|nr:LPS export ABC transporter permease LptF [Psychromarinibacter halotolerans]MDF0595122.1 LPS export ABC transporter permease LptF [Psychromarinibacter halotolerans]
MARFDRYILSQLLMLFGFFALVLVLVYWVNRAVVLFDQLIANGQSASVFFEFTALSLPNVIRIVLPIAVFAASVYVANRLSSESELVVVQATGFSPYRMMRPVLAYGLIVGVLLSVLTHLLVPLSITRLEQRQAEISENITARLLSEGQFLHPTDGITFYIREITVDGELRDVFLSDRSGGREHVTYTASRALLLRSDTGPKLVMFDGMAQALNVESGRLATTSFTDLSYDIGSFIGALTPGERGIKELSTLELLNPTPALEAETRRSAGQMIYEGHGRISQALLAVAAALVGFAAMLVGNFSRFGRWRQILGAVIAIVVVKIIDNTFADMARGDPSLWPLTYGAALIGFTLTFALLWISARPGLFIRRDRAAETTGVAA